MSLSSPEHLVEQVIQLVKSREQSFIRLHANGGNSILLVCHPSEEQMMAQLMQKRMDVNQYQFIDINQCLIQFVKENRSNLLDRFDLLRSSVEQIFKLPSNEEGEDLFTVIIRAIQESILASKVPVLLYTGALYGSGIDNIHIMEHPQVMSSRVPLIILYPATHEQDKLLFLGYRPASKYRCVIIE